jgi:hypothetical protein
LTSYIKLIGNQLLSFQKLKKILYRDFIQLVTEWVVAMSLKEEIITMTLVILAMRGVHLRLTWIEFISNSVQKLDKKVVLSRKQAIKQASSNANP